jgi:predicted ATPase with chaperone activity
LWTIIAFSYHTAEKGNNQANKQTNKDLKQSYCASAFVVTAKRVQKPKVPSLKDTDKQTSQQNSSMSFFQPKVGAGGQVGADGIKKATPPRLVPWVEKYRPKSMNDISHQDEAVESLRGALKAGTLPHLLFYGPPGTGETTPPMA